MLLLIVAGVVIVIGLYVAIEEFITVLFSGYKEMATVVRRPISQAEQRARFHAEFAVVCEEFLEQQRRVARWWL